MEFYVPKPLPKLDQLPVELVLSIVEHLSSDDDARSVQKALLAFSRVSLRFHAIITPYLYKHNVEKRGSSGFRWAVARRDLGTIKTLFEHGGDITTLESGYPLLVAIKKADVDLLKFIMLSAPKYHVDKACSQPVDDGKHTVLHWAIIRAQTPCVKVLLEAGAKMDALNWNLNRPLEFLFGDEREEPASHYPEILELLLEHDPAEMLRTIVDRNTFDLLGNTTPLILAASRGSLESVNAILEAGAGQDISEYINEISSSYGLTALASICDPHNWPSGKNGANLVLDIIKTLLAHGANPNRIDVDMEGRDLLPVYRCCLRPPSIEDPYQRLQNFQLQHDVISLLLDNGADVRIDDPQQSIEYNYCGMQFLENVEWYCIYILDPGKLYQKPEDILHDTHPALKFGTSDNDLDTWSYELDPEEEEKAEILYLLQDSFRLLLRDLEVNDFEKFRGTDEITLLHQAVTIPGHFGTWATQALLEKGASMKTTDKFLRSPLKYANEKKMNRASISILRRWRKAFQP